MSQLWPEDETNTLKRMREAGHSAPTIALALNCYVGRVKSKIKRLEHIEMFGIVPKHINKSVRIEHGYDDYIKDPEDYWAYHLTDRGIRFADVKFKSVSW